MSGGHFHNPCATQPRDVLPLVEAPAYKFSYTWHTNQPRGLLEGAMMEVHCKQISWELLQLS